MRGQTIDDMIMPVSLVKVSRCFSLSSHTASIVR